jgi:hypothetical protein
MLNRVRIMNRYTEVDCGAYMQKAENGFIVEVVQMEEQARDPSEFVEDGEPQAMGVHRAEQAPKTKAPVSKIFVYTTLKGALEKLEEYFGDE